MASTWPSPAADSIFVPTALLTSSDSTSFAENAWWSEHPTPLTPKPTEDIRILKTRPPRSRDGDPASPEARSRRTSFSFEYRTRPRGETEDALRLEWRDTPAHHQHGTALQGSISEDNTAYCPQYETSNQLSRRSSVRSGYNMASLVNIKHQRGQWLRILIEYAAYLIFVAFIYFILIGVPLWRGGLYWLHWLMQRKFVFQGGWAIVIAMLILYSFVPLLIPFEKDPPSPTFYKQRGLKPVAPDTALVIPCYRSAPIIGRTLEAALKIFAASNIYVVANGNSSCPLDNTEDICEAYGVNHIWCPVGSKIIAIFVGCYATKAFRYVLVMDDDCVLPESFPVVVSRLTNEVRCIGYTIKSMAGNSQVGTSWQQAQDLEYKMAGLQRNFSGRIGSATFPHGAISLWERRFLRETLEQHPGFSISEDWFIGHTCRRLGGRIQMCSAVFVETTTPSVFFPFGRNQTRGGFGETTVFEQRFLRWNFFVPNGLWYNLAYIVGSWRLGKWEIGTKIFVFQEVYETMLYFFTPFVLPISFIVRPVFCCGLSIAILGLYLLNALLFNEIHLRLKHERVKWKIVFYYVPYKIMISLVNVASCYWSLFKYARYFARRHPKLTEDHKAVGMVLRLEEITRNRQGERGAMGRRLTARRVNMP